MMTHRASITTDDAMQALWERLAEAVAQAGPQHERLFLAKFALLAARSLGNPEHVDELIKTALDNLT